MDPEIKLKPGTINEYSGSMAEAMEEAFKSIWPDIMGTQVPNINNHFRMIFIAIAQGIVKHLSDRADAFKVIVKLEGEGSDTEVGSGDLFDVERLHKHLTGTADHVFNQNWKYHTHPITETDTHNHKATVEILPDDTLIQNP